MRNEHLVFSLVGLLFASFLILVGLFLFFFCHFAPVETIQRFVEVHYKDVSFYGLALFALGTGLILIFSYFNRRHYVLIRMGSVSLHEKVIEKMVATDLRNYFKEETIQCSLISRPKNRVEIVANFPFVEEEKREQLFKELEALLSTTLINGGMRPDFLLNVHFRQAS